MKDYKEYLVTATYYVVADNKTEARKLAKRHFPRYVDAEILKIEEVKDEVSSGGDPGDVPVPRPRGE